MRRGRGLAPEDETRSLTRRVCSEVSGGTAAGSCVALPAPTCGGDPVRSTSSRLILTHGASRPKIPHPRLAACCTLLASGGGDCSFDGCDCNCSCCDGNCCPDCCPDIGAAGPMHGADELMWAGPFPRDPFWGYAGYGGYVDLAASGHNVDCGCCNCHCNTRSCCCPIASLVLVFPAMPENAWGGLVGCAGVRSSPSSHPR